MALPLFDFTANKVYDDEIEFYTLVTKFESQREQRRGKGSPRRRFSLVFEKKETDADAIRSFFEDRKGRLEPFLWEHPRTGEEITVRFDIDKLSRKVEYDVLFKHGLPIKEVLNE